MEYLMNILQLTISGLMVGGIYGLTSIGLTLVWGVAGVVNFAHGEFLMVAMYLSYLFFHYMGLDPLASIFLVAPILFMLGASSQRIVIQPILKAPHYNQAFATVGLSLFLQNLALIIWAGNFRSVKVSYATSVLPIGPIILSIPKVIGFLVASFITGLLYWFLRATYLGKAIRATAQDTYGAALAGIDVKRIYILSFGIGAACAGIAGALIIPTYYVFPTVGQYFVLIAFVVVVLGGMASLTSAFLGGLLIGVVESMSGFFLGSAYKELVYFLLFIFVLWLKPTGILFSSAKSSWGSSSGGNSHKIIE
ncbi:MAG: branched-chain amino acid ABC transporter permease [Thermodesulfobacteriota bacterium]|jgi:branched-chain amino acid transport system permease protein